ARINGVPYTITAANLSDYSPKCFSYINPVDAIATGGYITAPDLSPGNYDGGFQTDAAIQLDISGVGPIPSFTLKDMGTANGVTNNFEFTAPVPPPPPPPSTPTLSQWGLVLFSLLLLSF